MIPGRAPDVMNDAHPRVIRPTTQGAKGGDTSASFMCASPLHMARPRIARPELFDTPVTWTGVAQLSPESDSSSSDKELTTFLALGMNDSTASTTDAIPMAGASIPSMRELKFHSILAGEHRFSGDERKPRPKCPEPSATMWLGLSQELSGDMNHLPSPDPPPRFARRWRRESKENHDSSSESHAWPQRLSDECTDADVARSLHIIDPRPPIRAPVPIAAPNLTCPEEMIWDIE